MNKLEKIAIIGGLVGVAATFTGKALHNDYVKYIGAGSAAVAGVYIIARSEDYEIRKK